MLLTFLFLKVRSSLNCVGMFRGVLVHIEAPYYAQSHEMNRIFYLVMSILSVIFAQSSSLPQCSPGFNGAVGNGTAGSEEQLSSSTLRVINATDADQGVAVEADYFYSIDNFSIMKHRKATGESLLQWYGGEGGAIIHLDGGVVINGTLYSMRTSRHSLSDC